MPGVCDKSLLCAKVLLSWNFSNNLHPHTEILVHRDTLDLLSSIDEDVAVISIAGPHRSGKSFLMNRLAPHEDGKKPFQA